MRGERQMNKNSQRLEDGASGSPYVNRCGEYAPPYYSVIRLYISPTRTQSVLNQIEFCGAFISTFYTACNGVFSITFLNCSTVILAFSAARSGFKSPSRTSCTSIPISPILMPSLRPSSLPSALTP